MAKTEHPPSSPLVDLLPKQDEFLSALAEKGNVIDACKRSGIPPWVVFKWKKTDPDFAEKWAAAEECVAAWVEAEAIRRAVEGVKRPLWYKGTPVYVYRSVVDEDGNPVRDERGQELRELVRDEDGQPVQACEVVYSDTLMLKILAGVLPSKYGTTRTEVTGKDGEPLVKTTPIEDASRVAFLLRLGVEAKQALTLPETTFNFDGDLV